MYMRKIVQTGYQTRLLLICSIAWSTSKSGLLTDQIRFAHRPNQVCSPTKSGFVCLPACLSVCLSACLPACLPACLFYPVQQILIFNDSSTNSTHHLQTGFYFLVLLPSFSSLCKLKYSSLHGVPSGFIFGSVLWQILEWYFGFFT